MKRRGIVAFLSACVMAFASGCSSLPTSGPVQQSDVSGTQVQPLAQEALGPVPGATPERLVRDFVRAASAGAYDNYAVARKYLTVAAAKKWKPDSSIDVADEDSSIVVKAEGPTEVTVEAPLRETIGPHGAKISEGGRYVRHIELIKTRRGEYRISQLPNGIVISRTAFVNAFSQRNVYFLSHDEKVTIPEPRWVPQQRSVSALVAFLADGPSRDDTAIAHTAFPQGAKIVDRVESKSTNVIVYLSHEYLQLGPRLRSLIIWQLRETISNAGGVSNIEFSANGKPVLDKPPVAAPYDLTTLIGLDKGKVTQISTTGQPSTARFASVPGPLMWPARGPVAGTPVVVLSRNSGLYRVSNPQGTDSISEPVLLYGASDLSRPSVDRFGWVWSVRTHGPSALVVIDATGDQAPVMADDKSSQERLQALALSIDGSRFAAIYRQENGGQHVHIGIVERTENGVPTELVTQQTVSLKVDAAQDLTWVSQTSIAVFGTFKGPSSANEDYGVTQGAKAIETIPLTGDRAVVECRQDTQTIFGGGKNSGLYSISDSGVRYKLYGTQWRREGAGLRMASFPG